MRRRRRGTGARQTQLAKSALLVASQAKATLQLMMLIPPRRTTPSTGCAASTAACEKRPSPCRPASSSRACSCRRLRCGTWLPRRAGCMQTTCSWWVGPAGGRVQGTVVQPRVGRTEASCMGKLCISPPRLARARQVHLAGLHSPRMGQQPTSIRITTVGEIPQAKRLGHWIIRRSLMGSLPRARLVRLLWLPPLVRLHWVHLHWASCRRCRPQLGL